MKTVRLGVIGLGTIGRHHLGYLDRVRDLELTAICDTDAAARRGASEKIDADRAARGLPPVAAFETHQALVRSGLCDAALICTPHDSHPPIAMAAFRNGLHVLTEKPIGSHTLQAKQAIAAHRRARGLVFAAMFQFRTNPANRKARQLVESGALGELRMVDCIATNWFRPQRYFDSGSWRATWSGEGGALLLNQCPHTLDLLIWLAGMPTRVTAQVGLGKFHRIEAEDEANALLEFPNGAIGHFAASTGIAPGTSRIELAGDRAALILSGASLTLIENDCGSAQAFSRSAPGPFQKPGRIRSTFAFEGMTDGGHAAVTQNFVDAILRGDPLLAPAAEGLRSLALANAILLSGLTRKPVPIPFPDSRYKRLLDRLIRDSAAGRPTGSARRAPGKRR